MLRKELRSLLSSLEVIPAAGANLSGMCEAACVLANRLAVPVKFSFNDIPVLVAPGTHPISAARDWEMERRRALCKIRGTDAKNVRLLRNKSQAGGLSSGHVLDAE